MRFTINLIRVGSCVSNAQITEEIGRSEFDKTIILCYTFNGFVIRISTGILTL